MAGTSHPATVSPCGTNSPFSAVGFSQASAANDLPCLFVCLFAIDEESGEDERSGGWPCLLQALLDFHWCRMK